MTARRDQILVVDDEADVTDLVAYHLRANGWLVETLNDATKILDISRRFAPNLMIVDVNMPGLSGLQICRLFKADSAFRNIPIMLLTARTEVEDRILGLETGADDYVCKPFSPRELGLRVKRLLVKKGPEVAQEKRLVFGPISLDEERHEVEVYGDLVDLTLTEFRLLRVLMECRGRVQRREQLLVSVWKQDSEMETRTVDTHVRRLREKLGAACDLLETVRGVGYRINSSG